MPLPAFGKACRPGRAGNGPQQRAGGPFGPPAVFGIGTVPSGLFPIVVDAKGNERRPPAAGGNPSPRPP